MFSITLSEISSWILLISVLFFSLLWIFQKTPSNRVINIDKKHIYKCSVCGYTYFSKPIGKYSICPLCKSINTIAKELKTTHRDDIIE